MCRISCISPVGLSHALTYQKFSDSGYAHRDRAGKQFPNKRQNRLLTPTSMDGCACTAALKSLVG